MDSFERSMAFRDVCENNPERIKGGREEHLYMKFDIFEQLLPKAKTPWEIDEELERKENNKKEIT